MNKYILISNTNSKRNGNQICWYNNSKLMKEDEKETFSVHAGYVGFIPNETYLALDSFAYVFAKHLSSYMKRNKKLKCNIIMPFNLWLLNYDIYMQKNEK